MKITLVRDDGKVKTLRTLKMELLLEQMKTEVKAQPVSKMREVLRYTLPGNSIEEVRKELQRRCERSERRNKQGKRRVGQTCRSF